MSNSNSIHDESTVERLLRRIHTMRLRETRDPEVKQWVDTKLREHKADIRRVVGDNYQDFLLTYISREKLKFQHDADSRKNPYDECRETPLCTCGLACKIMSAEEPVEFKEADSLDAGVRRFKKSHPGHPLVLDDAREAWYDLEGDVEFVLEQLVTALSNNEIPDLDDSAEDLRAALEERRAADDEDGPSEGTEEDADGDADADGQSDVDSAISEVAARDD